MKIELWDKKKFQQNYRTRDFHGETQRDRSYVFLMKAFEIDIGNVCCMIWRTIIEHEQQIILVKLRNQVCQHPNSFVNIIVILTEFMLQVLCLHEDFAVTRKY